MYCFLGSPEHKHHQEKIVNNQLYFAIFSHSANGMADDAGRGNNQLSKFLCGNDPSHAVAYGGFQTTQIIKTATQPNLT